jgi:hypothetical protein
MAPAAPRIPTRLMSRIEKLARKPWPAAEINRLVGAYAEEIGSPRPSYEQVRRHVREIRREAQEPTVGSVALDVAFRVRPYRDLVDAIAFGEVPPRTK